MKKEEGMGLWVCRLQGWRGGGPAVAPARGEGRGDLDGVLERMGIAWFGAAAIGRGRWD